jgi:type VI secretion system secreted protein Hcp
MALNAYLTIVAEKQGRLRGSVTQKGREEQILVFGAFHEIVCPRDPASGRPTGKRMHKPFVILKDVDRASPLINSALAHNERLSTVELRFYQPSSTGQEKNHYTVTLTNATVSSMQLRLPRTNSPKSARLNEYEEIAFTYQKIDWTYPEGGMSAVDDWETPR